MVWIFNHDVLDRPSAHTQVVLDERLVEAEPKAGTNAFQIGTEFVTDRRCARCRHWEGAENQQH